jgi:hypothetical protein
MVIPCALRRRYKKNEAQHLAAPRPLKRVVFANLLKNAFLLSITPHSVLPRVAYRTPAQTAHHRAGPLPTL